MSTDASAAESGTDCNDFVIREGFPALRLAKGTASGSGDGGGDDRDTAAPPSVWHIDGPEPIPRHSFWGCHRALVPRDAAALAALRSDCRAVFAARARAGGEAYSAGVTYFCPALLPPRCALEALALEIFQMHTQHLADGVMVPEQSGAEWWTLVLDEDDDGDAAGSGPGNGNEDDESDEVGLHFDADYGLEDQTGGLLLHPRLATVTYLSDYGAPTVVFDRRSPPPNDADKKSLEGPINRGWLSAPAVGKHIAFDGRLLHGAPATFFPAVARANGGSSDGPAAEPPQKRTRLEPRARYTFLVNIWINHCPLDAEPLDEEVCSQLSAPPRSADGSTGASAVAYTWAPSMALDAQTDCHKVRLVRHSSDAEPAGEEEFVLGRHLVTCTYAVTMEDLHRAAAAGADADFIELNVQPGAVTLQVREYTEHDSDDNEE